MKQYIYIIQRIFVFSILFSLTVNTVFAQQSAITTVKGQVIDAQTNETLPYAGVFLEGTKVSSNTDMNGNFMVHTTAPVKKIRVGYVGYETMFVNVRQGETQNIKIQLKQNLKEINEVLVTPKKRKYRNKNNPAVELINQVIDHRSENKKENLSALEYEKYEKIEFALSNISEKFKNRKALRKFQFVFDNLDTTELSGKEVLPVYLKESLSRFYSRKNPSEKKDNLEAYKMVSFDGYVDNQGITEFLKYLYQDVDIYSNSITFLTNPFLSPIASTAPAFYKYFILDTLEIANYKCIKLSFAPRNKTDMLFQGFMYITMDSSYAVKKIEMSVNKDINLNWVKSAKIQQEFEKEQKQGWVMTKDELSVDFGISQSKMGVFGKRSVSYKDYKLNYPRPENYYNTPDPGTGAELENKNESFWKVRRHDPLSHSEAGIYLVMDSIQHIPAFRRAMDIFTVLFAGYKDYGYFEIGPINTFYSYNPIEGIRIRFGGRTTPKFSKKLTLETYAAYGDRDKKMKYYFGTTYSLTKRNIFEFPVKYIKASFQDETKIPGQDLQFIQEDNILLSIKRGVNDKLFYNKKFTLEHLNEFPNHLSFTLGYSYTQQRPAGNLYFNTDNYAIHTNTQPLLKISEVYGNIRFAPHEQFYQGKIYRLPFINKYPIFQLQYTAGLKFLGNDYDYQNLKLTISKRFFWPLLGYTDFILEGDKIFGKVPYPLLDIHRANQTYSYQILSYNLMNFLEFVSDQYASLNIDHCFNGFFFNRIPLVKKLKFRELISCKVLYGSLTKQNNPDYHPELFKFPTYEDGTPETYTLNKKPYVEASAGIGNILKVFRVDLVKRLSYLNNPHVSSTGIRVRFKLDF